MKPHSQQKGRKAEANLRRFPLPWVKVEEFLREYARDLSRAGDYPTGPGRIPGRNPSLEISGPAVILELSGSDRRIGVVPSGGQWVSLTGGRQRLLVLELRENGVFCFLVRVAEHGIESGELAMDLPTGVAERIRLERSILEAVENASHPHPATEGWEEPSDRLAQALRLMLALARAGRRMVQAAGKRASRSLQQFQQVMATIRAGYREDLPLPVVSQSIGLSPRHFARLLDQWSGTGFTEHVLMVRLMDARQRLTHSSANVEEIANAAGFGSRDHFIRAFRQYFGGTPLQFRKRWRAASEGREKWESVLAMPGRNPVEWLPAGATGRSPLEEPGKFHSMLVANATHQVQVLHRIGPDGSAIPEGALQPGGAIFLSRAQDSGFWRVDNALGIPVAAFCSSGPRSLAVITA